jgi:hypothetical protein
VRDFSQESEFRTGDPLAHEGAKAQKGRQKVRNLRLEQQEGAAKPTADFASAFVRATRPRLLKSTQVIDLAEREGFEPSKGF